MQQNSSSAVTWLEPGTQEEQNLPEPQEVGPVFSMINDCMHAYPLKFPEGVVQIIMTCLFYREEVEDLIPAGPAQSFTPIPPGPGESPQFPSPSFQIVSGPALHPQVRASEETV